MAYHNVHLSLGWVSDERVVSFEMPDDWDELTREHQWEWEDQCYQDALDSAVESWTTKSDEPEER